MSKKSAIVKIGKIEIGVVKMPNMEFGPGNQPNPEQPRAGTLFIRKAFILVSDHPLETDTPKSGIEDSYIYTSYVPGIFRRPRLKRFAGFGESLTAAHATYRWRRKHPCNLPSPIVFQSNFVKH